MSDPTDAERWCGQSDTATRKRAARDALDALTGPERVEVLRHYASSAKKAISVNQPSYRYVYVSCDCCDCCDCGAS